MSFGLSRGKTLEAGSHGILANDLPPLPDDVLRNPTAAHIDPREWFGDPGRPFELEIGSGKGTFLVQQAGLQPETNFLGIEWAHEFYLYAADRIRRNQLDNVRMMHADATEFLRWRMPPEIIRVIHLYFSDPWPKTKHHKRRVVQDGFLADCWRALVPGGEMRIVTDHSDYWQWMERHFDRWTSAESAPLLRESLSRAGCADLLADSESKTDSSRAPYERLEFERPESAGEGEVVGTNFERKYRREGRPFHAAILRKPNG